MSSLPPGAPEANGPRISLIASRQFGSWLQEVRASLAFTTYQAGKLYLIGSSPNGRLTIFDRTFNRCMGLCAIGRSLYMSSLYQIWRFENALAVDERHKEFDALYVPRLAWTTGDLDVHDVAVNQQGTVFFANTLFSCIATTSEIHSFRPVWHPRFISRLAAEDRCHLNGLALADEAPRYVTAVADSDATDGWRDRRPDGGVLLDTRAEEPLLSGLSMPHSPRYHDNRLWFLESGRGYFGYYDPTTRQFERVAFCPGYARGLGFIDRYAVIGLSLPRNNRTFQDLPLDGELQKRKSVARCGLVIVDMRSGDVVHWLRIEGLVSEIYDVATLPGVARPMALGFRSDEIRRFLTIGPPKDPGISLQ